MFVDLTAGISLEEIQAQHPEVLRIASSLYDYAVESGSDYLSPTEDHQVEVSPDLGYVLLKDLFVPDLVLEIVDFTKRRKYYDHLVDRDVYFHFYADNYRNNNGALDYLGSSFMQFSPGVEGIRVSINKYEKTLSRAGKGESHLDLNTGGSPVALLASGPGYVELSKRELEEGRVTPTGNDYRIFERESAKGETIILTYGGGDVLVFDGTRRLHRGAVDLTGSLNAVRHSLVVYPVK